MSQIKGKFIILTFNLMTSYPKAQEEANIYFNKHTGKDVKDLDIEAFYDTKHFNYMMELYVRNSCTNYWNYYKSCY